MSLIKARYSIPFEGRKLEFDVPHDVFSTQRIDEGTLLLLSHLPVGAQDIQPKRILEMGCGYGALGLPIALKYPEADVELVDRDLLAVEWCQHNANLNKLHFAPGSIRGSLGFRDVSHGSWDWILCNVPARIGDRFIEHLVLEGCRRLSESGKLILVVISDLSTTLRRLHGQHRLKGGLSHSGPRHDVWIFDALSVPTEGVVASPVSSDEALSLYCRDEVLFMGQTWWRPYDWGGDDPKRIQQGLPLLIDFLPRDPNRNPSRILCLRPGYGIIPVLLQRRWPAAKIEIQERDLLASTFLRMNSERILSERSAGSSIHVVESPSLKGAWGEQKIHAQQDLVVGELSSSAGLAVARDEILTVQKALAPGGQALLLCHNKFAKDALGLGPLTALVRRDQYSVLRLASH
jgi:16S rRNA (guanine1207-N2)-methyltransferase